MEYKHLIPEPTNYAKNIDDRLTSMESQLKEIVKALNTQTEALALALQNNKELLIELKILRTPANN